MNGKNHLVSDGVMSRPEEAVPSEPSMWLLRVHDEVTMVTLFLFFPTISVIFLFHRSCIAKCMLA